MSLEIGDGEKEEVFPLGLVVTFEDAVQIRTWRVQEGYSWRAVASVAWDAFGNDRAKRFEEVEEDWPMLGGVVKVGGGWPKLPSNQLAGMELCRRAALIVDDADYMTAVGWNS